MERNQISVLTHGDKTRPQHVGPATAKPKGKRGQFSKGWLWGRRDTVWEGFMEEASLKVNPGTCVCQTDWMGKASWGKKTI